MKRWLDDERIAALTNAGRLRESNCELVRLTSGSTEGRARIGASGGIRRAAADAQAGVEPGPLTIPKTAPGRPVTSLSSLPVAKPSKFRNVKTNGYASTREANRAAELKLLEASGEILGLREQVPFILIPEQDGERPCRYLADFTYTTKRGEYVVEDTKGVKTADYIIKRKLMLHVHGIRIREV